MEDLRNSEYNPQNVTAAIDRYEMDDSKLSTGELSLSGMLAVSE